MHGAWGKVHGAEEGPLGMFDPCRLIRMDAWQRHFPFILNPFFFKSALIRSIRWIRVSIFFIRFFLNPRNYILPARI
jgi:hypothetical protein